MLKRTVAALLAVALIIGVGAGTLSYLNDAGSMVNRLRAGTADIEVDETYTPPPELTEGDNTFTKDVRIRNTGDIAVYVRVLLEFSDSEVAKNAKFSLQPLEKNTGWQSADSWRDAHTPEGWKCIRAQDPDGDLLGGFYYYTKPVKPGEETSYLLRAVNAHFASAADVTDFEIFVSAEAVQTRNAHGELYTGTDPWRQAWKEFLGRR